jgi:DNA-binding beta-propeller fold protein YncE
VIAALAAVACGDSPAPAVPASGLMLLDLRSGAPVASLSVGSDAVAVTLSADGSTAFVADSSPGDVYAVRLATRRVLWRAHTGGAPFGILFGGDRIYVSLFTAGAVDELALDTGRVLASHPVGQGPARMAIDVDGRPLVALHSGGVATLDGHVTGGAQGFGIVTFGSEVWTCDYAHAKIVRVTDGQTFTAPMGLSPFWLAAGAGPSMLIASEGADEDRDQGGVFRMDIGSGAFTVLARPKDPDQVVEAGGVDYVAAHGDHDVLAISRGRTQTWARGAAAVALAADPQLSLLVVAVNSHE